MNITLQRIEEIEAEALKHPQVEMPLTHRFAPGVYAREIFMPKGTFVIGHQHNTEHFNIVLSGEADVYVNDKAERLKAGCVFVSGVGVRKMLHILEDMRWMTIHATDETNVEKLEDMLITQSESFKSFKLLEGGKPCRWLP